MTGDAPGVGRRRGFESLVAVEASLPCPGPSAAAGGKPKEDEEDEEEEEEGMPHAAPCRQPDDFSGASSVAVAAFSVPFGARSCSRFLSHSCSASFISLHHLKWWL